MSKKVNRNLFFLLGLLILLLGAQFRMVDSFVLNEKSTQVLAKRFNKAEVASLQSVPAFMVNSSARNRHTVRPPRWLGWVLLSTGSVLVLQSFAMKKPD